ncbi:MAG: hypothetical protein ACFFFT_16370 [Candidatus Thorarchaeota archaeon]
MMAKKAGIIIIIMIVLGIILIITIPVFIISTNLSAYGKIDESIPFYYNASNSSLMESLNINADVGEIDIKYINEPVDYCVKVEIDFEMGGLGLAGKTYLDYFNINWQNSSGLVNLTIALKSGVNHDDVLSLIKNVNITVSLKSDVICDVSIIIKNEGDVKITVPWLHSIGNVLTNLSRGNIQYNLFYCVLKGNITGIIQDTGNIKVKSFDVKYTQNSMWSLYTNYGDIFIEISQNKAMDANITGIITTQTGNYQLIYKDNATDVGAYFILHVNPDDYAINQKINEIVGFEFYVSPINGTDVYHITSDEYPAQYNYNWLLNFPIGVYEELELQNT